MAFRFETLDVYKMTLEMSGDIFIIVKDLQSRRDYGIADQLIRAFLSISNNIAEGSGSNSDKEFAYFLNIAKRSAFECASMIIFLHKNGFISFEKKTKLNSEFDLLSRKIESLRKSVLNS
jgi:four helix bundle protein